MTQLNAGYHPVVLGADTTDIEAGTLRRIGNFFTMGVPSAATSGLLSIYNSFVPYLGGNYWEAEDAVRTAFGDTTADYYMERKDALDIVGLVATAIIPGSLGLKAVKLARAGAPLGHISTALGYTSSRSSFWLQQGIKETAESGGVMRSLLESTARRRQALWETADQALLSTAAEIAIVGTMHNSPVFNDWTASDFAWNMALGAGIGGVFGGGFNSIAARGVYKQSAKAVQDALRGVDVIYLPTRTTFPKGTELAESISNMIANPNTERVLDFNYVYRGEASQAVINITPQMTKARADAVKLAQQQLAIRFNELAAGNATVGQAMFRFISTAVEDTRALGKDSGEVMNVIHSYLENVSKVGPVSLDALNIQRRKFYINLEPKGDTRLEQLVDSFSAVRGPKTTKQAYAIRPGFAVEDLNVVTAGQVGSNKLTEIWATAPQADVVQLLDGTFRFNPRSAKIARVKENLHEVQLYLDLRTADLTPEALPQFGDTILKDKFASSVDFISSGQQSFRMPASVVANLGADPLEATARFAWASDRSLAELQKITGGNINLHDFALVQRLLELAPEASESALKNFNLITPRGTIPVSTIENLKQYVDTARLNYLAEFLDRIKNDATIPEARIIAANLGVTQDWVEEAIESGFALPTRATVLETAAAKQPTTIAMTWTFDDTAAMTKSAIYKLTMGPSFIAHQALAQHYKQVINTQVTSNAVRASLGADADLIIDFETFLPTREGRTAAQTADADGAGASIWGAANADYGDRGGLAAQASGSNVAQLNMRRRDAVVETLAPYVNNLRSSPEAAAELSIVTTALRKSPLKYVFESEDSLRIVNYEAKKYAIANKIDLDEAIEIFAQADKKYPQSFNFQHVTAADLMRAHANINHKRQGNLTPLWNAVGLTRKLPEEAIVYAPPINTRRYPHYAFVRTKNKIGVTQAMSVITAKNEDQLRALAAKVSDDYDVLFSKDIANFHKAQGDYDYGLTLTDTLIDSDLARKGVFADHIPETRYQNVMEDYLYFHAGQEQKHIRLAVQVQNRRWFSEMNFLSEQYRRVSESRVGGFGKQLQAKVADPFGDYIKTALDVSKQQEFPLLDSLNDFIDGVGIRMGEAYESAFRDAKAGLISWEEANKVAARFGLGMPYTDEAAYMLANERYPVNFIREGIQKINMVLATTLLRFDMAHTLVTMMSTPITAGTEMASILGRLAKHDPTLGVLNELTKVKVPGMANVYVPSWQKLLMESSQDYWRPGKEALVGRFKNIGAVKGITQQFHEIMDVVSFNPAINPSKWMNNIDAAVETTSKLTGNTFAEEFARFVSANMMKRLTDPLVAAGKLSIKEQDAFIITYTNRAQGNYTTSQRPILFQGTTGAAISLFQTYFFNVMQQLFRHTQAGDKKTLMLFAGLQSSIFGLNGLPFFDAVNTHIIGSWMAGNPTHQDAYGVLPGANKELGDWMLYGTASAFPLFSGSMPALFTRGDLNPRHITIVPHNPLDVPAVAASLKLINTLISTGRNIGGGADITDALLQGLQHQGWNRPLAGFGQLLAGQSTTASGTLISAANDLQATTWLGSLAERFVEFDGAARLLGARPMDEAIALDTVFRQKTYQALDRARIERLGRVVKTKLHGGEFPTHEELDEFILEYVSRGGRIENFNRALQRWNRDANVSMVNRLAARLHTPYGQTLMTIMGGEPLPDHVN